MKIRVIKRNDIEKCAQLYAEVFSSEPWHENWSPSLAYERLMHFYDSKGFVGVLAEEKEIFSFALGNIEPFYSGAFFYLREMCTKPNAQNQGIGKKTIKSLEDTLASMEVKNIYLITERSIPAANFYTACGFDLSADMGFYSKTIKS